MASSPVKQCPVPSSVVVVMLKATVDAFSSTVGMAGDGNVMVVTAVVMVGIISTSSSIRVGAGGTGVSVGAVDVLGPVGSSRPRALHKRRAKVDVLVVGAAVVGTGAAVVGTGVAVVGAGVVGAAVVVGEAVVVGSTVDVGGGGANVVGASVVAGASVVVGATVVVIGMDSFTTAYPPTWKRSAVVTVFRLMFPPGGGAHTGSMTRVAPCRPDHGRPTPG